MKEHTFLFVDLAGFTALTEAHGDDHAADLAQRFCHELNDGADWFGTAVNTAARIAELAAGDDVLLSEATRTAAGAPAGVRDGPARVGALDRARQVGTITSRPALRPASAWTWS